MENMSSQKQPLLTVLMLSYNDEAYVGNALESVLNQHDFKDLEIVITDDASQDNTANIIKTYESKYPDIIRAVYNPVNLGITENFNQTLKRCRGKYISFLAADDRYNLDKLKKQIHIMESNPDCVLSYHNVTVFGSAVKKEYAYYGGIRGRQPLEPKGGDISLFITERNFLVASAVMIKRNPHALTLAYKEIPNISDWLFFAEVSLGGDVIYIDEILGGYRRHQKNVTSSFLDIDEFEKSYDILKEKYPTYKSSINKGKARLYLSYSVLFLLRKDIKKSRLYMQKALKLLRLGGIHSAGFLIKSFVKDVYQYSVRLASGWKV